MVKNILYLSTGIIFFIFYIKYIERRSLFFPTRPVEVFPDAVNLKYEDVNLNSASQRINGWFVGADNAKYTILFFHGNGGNISHRLEKLAIFHDLGLSSFIIDYRGYGRSTGVPSEQGLYQDAGSAYDYLIKERRIIPERVIFYGESLGGAVAVDLAAKVPGAALIVDSSFSSVRDMAKAIYPFLPEFILSDWFNSAAKVPKITIPKLFIHSKNDEIVPYKLAQKLYSAAAEPKKSVEIIGSHNTGFMDSRGRFISSLKEFTGGLK